MSQLFAKHGELTNELSRVKLRHAAGATVSNDLKPTTRTCDRPAKCAKMTLQLEESSTTPSTATFLNSLPEHDNFEKRCEALALKHQCIRGLATEAKELREELLDREVTDATAKAAPKLRGRKRPTTTYRQVVALEKELAKTKAAHA